MRKKISTQEFKKWAFQHILWTNKIKELIGNDLPIQQWQVLLMIAREPGVSSKEICLTLQMKPAALSRHIKQLSIWYDKDPRTGKEIKKGRDFINADMDPRNRRALNYYLTDNGKEVVEQIYMYLEFLNNASENSN